MTAWFVEHAGAARPRTRSCPLVSPPPRACSTSRYRAELLARLGVPFESCAPDFDEEAEAGRFDELGPALFAAWLARGKAASLRAACPDAWILAADQVGVLMRDDGRSLRLGKPGSEAAALAQLEAMSGCAHELLTAVVLAGPDGAPPREALDRHRLTMRAFSREEAARYVARHRPLDCAGSYRIEDAGIALFERIEGDDYTSSSGAAAPVALLLRSRACSDGNGAPARRSRAENSDSLGICAPTRRDLHPFAAKLAGLEVPEFVAPVHHQVVLREMRFHYLDWGTKGKLPTLFLHGGGQTARTWDLCCLALRRELHCIALDQRGHGDSEWSYAFAYTPSDHAGDVLRAARSTCGITRVLVVGMSMGCLNGLPSRSLHPETRGRPSSPFDAGPWIQMEGGKRIVEFTREAAESVDLDAWLAAACRFNPRRDARLLRQGLLHNLRELPDGSLVWKTDRRRWTDLAAMITRIEALRAQIGAVRCPVLIVRGADSDVFSDDAPSASAGALPDWRWLAGRGGATRCRGPAPRAGAPPWAEFPGPRRLV